LASAQPALANQGNLRIWSDANQGYAKNNSYTVEMAMKKLFTFDFFVYYIDF